jgi:hypothetical protein
MRFNQLLRGISLVVVASFISRDVDAQSVASRVANARDGKVRFTFAPKPGVCGNGNSISRNSSNHMNWSSNESPDVTYEEECSHSPVRIVLSVNSGKVTKLRTYVGGQWRATEATTDLGALSTRDATSYLIEVAKSDDGRVGQEAILPLTLADSVNVYPAIASIARDASRPKSTRQQATFWLGQAAADVVAPDREYGKASDDEEIKKQAVFALSQRRREESVPFLIQVAKNNKDAEVRRSALFWLGQTGDPRAVDLFAEILSK